MWAGIWPCFARWFLFSAMCTGTLSQKSTRFLSSENTLYANSPDLCHTLLVANPNSCKAGHCCSLNYEDLNYIKFCCPLHSSIFLDELEGDLLSRCDVKVSLSILFRTLQRLGITCRKVSSHALEQNDQHVEHDVYSLGVSSIAAECSFCCWSSWLARLHPSLHRSRTLDNSVWDFLCSSSEAFFHPLCGRGSVRRAW
jgi:hypothetical protein